MLIFWLCQPPENFRKVEAKSPSVCVRREITQRLISIKKFKTAELLMQHLLGIPKRKISGNMRWKKIKTLCVLQPLLALEKSDSIFKVTNKP